MEIRVALTPEKAAKWTAIIRRHLQDGRISHPGLESPIWNLRFPQTCLFGKFASAKLRCMYRKLREPLYSPSFLLVEAPPLHWWEDVSC